MEKSKKFIKWWFSMIIYHGRIRKETTVVGAEILDPWITQRSTRLQPAMLRLGLLARFLRVNYLKKKQGVKMVFGSHPG